MTSLKTVSVSVSDLDRPRRTVGLDARENALKKAPEHSPADMKQPSSHSSAPWSRRAVLSRVSAAMFFPLWGLPSAGAQSERSVLMDELLRVWRHEGGVLLIRHAATEAGLGDPPGFMIGQCRTQRNLSEAGRQASRALGARLEQQKFKPDSVLSSQWCRCQDTARLAFGKYEDWPALNSTFAGQGDPAGQQKALHDRLQVLPSGRTEVWVTHQVIMTGLTGAYPGMGEGFVVNRQGRMVARAEVAA